MWVLELLAVPAFLKLASCSYVVEVRALLLLGQGYGDLQSKLFC